MKKKKRIWQLTPAIILAITVPPAISLISLWWDYKVALGELCASVVVIAAVYLGLRGVRHDMRSLVAKTAAEMDPRDRNAMQLFPLPLVVVGECGEIVLYNEPFRKQVLGGIDQFGADLKSIVKNLTPASFAKAGTAVDVVTKRRRFTVYGNQMERGFYTLYWVENTELKNIADEFRESRPVIAMIMIDNYDELMQNAREGEKVSIVSQIEKELVRWVSGTTGFLRHADRDKYLFIFEERHLRKIVESRFDILDGVRKIVAGEHMPATLSIGVGRGGKTFGQAEEMARQALDMALGRGGDQAAVKTSNGFEFYGGVSKAVEKRTKVKTRIIASALAELIDGSDNVLIMGHRNGDLDSLGAAVALRKACISRGRDARIVVDLKTCLAAGFAEQLRQNEEGYADAFIAPEECLMLVMRKTLLIVVDTHRKGFVESQELYRVARTVVVIDHHRKMVDFIDNAVIFYHETYASSSSEMVAELMQYIADSAVTSVEASALLAGMTLDTRNFSVRTGVRTFEAAGYLRRKGADTARVKQLFAGSMGDYQKRTALVSSARINKGCAIAMYTGEPDPDIKLIAPQAADDLLTISGVQASFVLYADGNGTAMSARSMGAVNVQLVMETLGGGGHLTMAGAQLPDVPPAEAGERLEQALARYFENNK
ncbi:MAG: DHH family phosphoesterase [Ethanoligenens sp.]|uniref:DHH family phosphoesterase n=1 Tax=Ethanoligenens sp. TaxID=2099655 RepID=UPI0039E86785